MGEAIGMRSYYGDREAIRGWSAPQFDQLVPVSQVEFTKAGNKVEFLTIIGIGQTEPVLRKLAGEVISMKSDQIVIQLPKGDPLTVQRGLVRISGAAAAH
jgi:hypothetical protein